MRSRYAVKDGFVYIRGRNISNLIKRFYGARKVRRDIIAFPLNEYNASRLHNVARPVKDVHEKAVKELSSPLVITISKRRPDKVLIHGAKKEETKRILLKAGCWHVKGGFSTHLYRVRDLLGVLSRNGILAVPPVEMGNIGEMKAASAKDLKRLHTSDLLMGKTYIKENVTYLRSKHRTNFEAAGIDNLYDLLTYAPIRYIDRSNPLDLSRLVIGESATAVGKILGVSSLPDNRGTKFSIKDESGPRIDAVFWGQKWLAQKFSAGDIVSVTGKCGYYRGRKQLNGELIEPFESASLLPVVPLHRQASKIGLTHGVLTALMEEAVGAIEDQELKDIFSRLHFPQKKKDAYRAVRELASKEIEATLFLSRLDKLGKEDDARYVTFRSKGEYAKKCLKEAGFTPTESQGEAFKEFRKMCSSGGEGILIADVGAGKTLVSQVLALDAVESGYQAAFVAPTTVLARQIYDATRSLAKGAPREIKVELIDGSLSPSEAREARARIKNGECDIVVGTTSLLGKNVKFSNLGLAIVDEQQKFGVDQRDAIRLAREDGLVVPTISQTATPIPRTVAHILYEGMTVVEMKGKPAGRLPIITEWAQEDFESFAGRLDVWGDVYSELDQGHKLLVVAPLVEESEKIESDSVEGVYKALVNGPLSEYNVGFVHGKVDKATQNQRIQDLKDGKLDVLVGSAVIEVGVDVKDATRIMILSPERMGASTLHQIRGRIGRNDKQGKCWLVTDNVNESSEARIMALVNSNDGMEIAKQDLFSRGQGNLLGSDQSGSGELRFFDINKHFDLVESAKAKADQIIESGATTKKTIEEAEVFARVTGEQKNGLSENA